MRKNRLNAGQSLFEVLFAVAVSALIISGVASLATVSVRNSTFSRNNSVATRFTQQANEWLRGERDADWSAFLSNVQANNTHCLNTLSWNPGSCGTTDFVNGDTVFIREVTFSCLETNSSPPPPFSPVGCGDPDVNNIETQVEVSWSDAQGDHSVSTNTRFTNWTETY